VLFFFTFDDQADVGTPEQILNYCETAADAMRYPDKPRPEGEWVGAELARQYEPLSPLLTTLVSSVTDLGTRFFLRLRETSTETFRRRFIKSWVDFATAVAKESEYRSQGHFPDLESYFTLRRLTIGTFPTFIMHELDMDIPDEIREHPILAQLDTTAVDIIAISNVSLFFRGGC